MPAVPIDSDAPVKNLALVGLTQEGETGRAWLLDLATHSQEAAGVGETVFGFQVKEIGSESVRLTRDAREYLLWLGEKSVPERAELAALSGDNSAGLAGATGPSGLGDPPGFPRRAGRGEPGGFRGRGGAGNFRGFGTATIGAGSSGTANSRRSASRTTNSSRSSRVRTSGTDSSTASPRGGLTGGLGGNGFARNNNSSATTAFSTTSQFGTESSSPTSNPQTARRTGRQLLAGTQSQGSQSQGSQPAAIVNPQTQRRTGTTTAGNTSRTGTSGSGATTLTR